jgi:hypothetical protein
MMHVLASLWVLIGNELGEKGWIGEEGMIGKPAVDIYITSLYWVVTTLSTVGYGDVSGNTYQEYLFTMAVEVNYYFIYHC